MHTVETQFFHHTSKTGFHLESGSALAGVTVAYETYGTLNAHADNAILLFHAMTGSQHAAGYNPAVPNVENLWTDECQTGWWNDFIGKNCALNTDVFFVICANYIGGCYGSSGPRSIDPHTGDMYGSKFPQITIADVVNSQLLLLDSLNIKTVHAVIGCSTGGMLAIDFATRFPQRVRNVIPIATGIQIEILQKLHILEQIYAIENDKSMFDELYPRKVDGGLLLARMIAHKSFVSLQTITERAQKRIDKNQKRILFHTLGSEIESYMLHHAEKFTKRFDRYSYLLILEMWLTFDLLKTASSATLPELFTRCRKQNYLIFSISSDVCFYPDQQDRLHQLLKAVDVPSTYITVHSDKGHDSFLLEPALYTPYLRYTLEH